MAWSSQQETALKSVKEWLKSGTRNHQVFRLDGFAGTGKTTLAKHMADMVSGGVNYATLSGKAASVLQSKGCFGASTIHSLIYKLDTRKLSEMQNTLDIISAMPGMEIAVEELKKDIVEKKRNPNAMKWKLRHRNSPWPSNLYNASLLVLDEVSMVGEDLGKDLLSFDVPILAIGDPAQLPPIKGEGFFQRGTADITLTEIHRQAKDNPIIAMSMKIREGNMLGLGDYGEGNRVLSIGEAREIMCDSDVSQVLCGTNDNRQRFNRNIRRSMGVENDMPLENDKLICLKNDLENRTLLNGTIWYVREFLPRTDQQKAGGILPMSIYSIDNEDVDAKITSSEDMFKFKSKEKLKELKQETAGLHQFDYGYAITVHKSQGSQWDNVVVFDDSWPVKEDKMFRYKWLYTAITRASEKVTILGNR